MPSTKYPVNETFYSLKGEGRWTGTPMFFIRLSGCNRNCDFCDTNHKPFEERTVRDLLEEARTYPTKRIVITGGEPLIHNLEPLVETLSMAGYYLHLESNGDLQAKEHFFWKAVSPKDLDFDPMAVRAANEVKVLAGSPNWRVIASFVSVQASPSAYLYIMPLAKPFEQEQRSPDDLIEENILEAITYCKQHPKFSLCMQLHKLLRIK